MRRAFKARWLIAVSAAASVALAVPNVSAAWSWPATGAVLRPFVFGSDPYAGGQHRGIDVGAEAAERLVAAAGGTVTFAGTVPTNGKTVTDRKSTRLNSSHIQKSRMPSSA